MELTDVEAHRLRVFIENALQDMQESVCLCRNAARLVQDLSEAVYYINEIKDLKKAISELQSEIARIGVKNGDNSPG